MTRRIRLVGLLALFLMALALVSCQSMGTEPPPQVKPAPETTVPSETSAVEKSEASVSKPAARSAMRKRPERIRVPVPAIPKVTDETVVARVGEREILGAELRESWLAKLQPASDPYAAYLCVKPIDPNAVLLELMGKIVLAQDGRKHGLLTENHSIWSTTQRYRNRLLTIAAANKFVAPLVTVSDEEIKAAMEKDPKLTDATARATLQRRKGQQAYKAYTDKLRDELQLKIHNENFAQAAALHKRLLEHPIMDRKNPWIYNEQVRTELSDEEKAVVLASCKGGTYTIFDLLSALNDLAPPSRPRNLNSPEGIGPFLERLLPAKLVVVAAETAGLDKDPEVAKRIRDFEDERLYANTQIEVRKDLTEPTEDEIAATFEKQKQCYNTGDRVKVDTIWCRTRVEADLVSKALAEGQDVNDLRTEHMFEGQATEPLTLSPDRETHFWAPIWAAEPNEVVGPILGFFPGAKPSLQWRVLKVLEKTAGEVPELTSSVKESLKWRIQTQRQEEAIAAEAKKLLKDTPHKTFPQYLDHFDPTHVP